MADLEFYKLSMTGEEADSGIRTGMEAGAISGVLLGDGNGGVTAATPGRDFGYPLLEGNGPPTGNTAANIGQHYFDMQATAAPYEYICVGLNSNGFIWMVFGDTGDGFKISGFFVSLEALEAAISAGTVPAPTEGTAYGIGEAAPYDIYVWDAVNSDWVNNGPLGSSGGGSGVPPHGDTGQVLTKLSDLDGDAGWKDIALKGEGAPTASTVGMIGQLYVDTTANENPAYICVGISTADNVTSYVWQPVGGTIEDGSITAEKLAPNAIPDALGFNPGMVNPNLLDNWYFVNPVNQRGFETATGGATYTIDRWKKDGSETLLSLTADGLEVTPAIADRGFNQPFELPAEVLNRPVTLSALVKAKTANCALQLGFGGGGGYQEPVEVGTVWSLVQFTNTFTTGTGFVIHVVNPGETLIVKAVKLELGSQQTLAHQENGVWGLNEIPDYYLELAKCRWYYRNYLTLIGSVFYPNAVDTGIHADDMRVPPAINCEGVSLPGTSVTAVKQYVSQQGETIWLDMPAGSFPTMGVGVYIYGLELISDL